MESIAVESLRESMILICYVSAPVLLTALSIGFFISFVQAVTQIQEQTLSFIPKIMGVFLVLLVCFSWMIKTLVTFSQELLLRLPEISYLWQ